MKASQDNKEEFNTVFTKEVSNVQESENWEYGEQQRVNDAVCALIALSNTK